ncbi:MAG TPA: hypothetical protein VFR35_13420 [Actinoplanes sp.]|nr:hypothetical protein [Actinoplanes sp.]
MEDDRLSRLEHDVERLVPPAWRRRTQGEKRWPSAVCILVLIGLQWTLPEQLSLGPRWLLPSIEVVLIAVLMAANPRRIEPGRAWLRPLSLMLIGVASLGTAGAVWRLVAEITGGHEPGSAADLLSSGGGIWLINVLVFAVWYWEADRGGPMKRGLGEQQRPDLLFPQMGIPELAREWEPQFIDYLYLAFTNSTAFSPTDTLPLARWAKALMMLQAVLSLLVAALVVAKAVNALQ